MIDDSAMQIAVVVDQNLHLVGTITDGDIRRGILKGVSLNDKVGQIMNHFPAIASDSESYEEIVRLMTMKKLHQIPIVNREHQVVGVHLIEELLKMTACENSVVLMAGGYGKRLRPLTNECPKPLLRVGSKPILETIIENFVEHGFKKFYISVNYKAEMLEEYFGDGKKWNIEIQYLKEKEELGTAGALSLLRQKQTKPIIVMNGDILTKVNFKQLIDFHSHNEAKATMCVREYCMQVPYGVVNTDQQKLISIVEKPTQRYFVNAGIYVIQPECLADIPNMEYFDMPTLFQKLITKRDKTIVFPIHEYWIDIGQVHDYERANGEYFEVFR